MAEFEYKMEQSVAVIRELFGALDDRLEQMLVDNRMEQEEPVCVCEVHHLWSEVEDRLDVLLQDNHEFNKVRYGYAEHEEHAGIENGVEESDSDSSVFGDGEQIKPIKKHGLSNVANKKNNKNNKNKNIKYGAPVHGESSTFFSPSPSSSSNSKSLSSEISEQQRDSHHQQVGTQ